MSSSQKSGPTTAERPKFSDLVCQCTDLWCEWNKAYARFKDPTVPMSDRAKSARETERIVEEVNRTIGDIDGYFE